MDARQDVPESEALMSASTVCWICRTRPADTSEHRFKASDVRAKAPRLSQVKPVFLQREGKATNNRVGSAKSKSLTFAPSICADCNNRLTQPYDLAWQQLSGYLQTNWPAIVRRGRFDLSKAFPGGTRKAALDVHLYFVKLFGCKLNADNVPIDIAPFSAALLNGTAHPEVSLFVAHSRVADGIILSYDSEVHTLRDQEGELHSALWMYLIHPVAIKVSYVKAGTPVLRPPGQLWHPSSPGKVVRLSDYDGLSEPAAGDKALLPPVLRSA
jgi:hypothetical protein